MDVVQEATYQAYKSIHSLKNPEYFTTWFTRIVIRCAGNVIKKRDNVIPLSDELLTNLPDESNTNMEEPSALLHAVQQLRLNYRTAILLFYLKKILTAKASSSLVYETLKKFNDDHIHILKAIDNHGTVYRFGNEIDDEDSEQKDGYHSTVRRDMTKLNPNATSLTFYPQLSIADPTVERRLDKKTFTLKSERLDLGLQVNDVIQNGEKLVIDYQLTGLPKSVSQDHIYHNLENAFLLVDETYRARIENEHSWTPKNHSISLNKVKTMDKATAHYQSAFELNGNEKIEHFKMENIVLLFNFSDFVPAKKLKPFTVQLPVEEDGTVK